MLHLFFFFNSPLKARPSIALFQRKLQTPPLASLRELAKKLELF